MSKTSSLHHIVISTKYRANSIPEAICEEMYRVLNSEVQKEGSKPLCINGVGNHIHLLVDFGPYTSRANLLKYIKQNSSYWAKRSGKFPLWQGWAKEYYCFSVSFDRKSTVINYINNQKEHHKHKTFKEELTEIFAAMGLNWIDYEFNDDEDSREAT